MQFLEIRNNIRFKDVMPFARYVETGRVALVADGSLKGKLVSIVDVIDQTRVLVDGPGSGVPRQKIRLNQLHLTKFRLSFPFTAPTRIVRKAWTDAKLDEKWAASQWAQKLANKEKRAQMTDYDRRRVLAPLERGISLNQNPRSPVQRKHQPPNQQRSEAVLVELVRDVREVCHHVHKAGWTDGMD
ncbi:unnamed protein product [Leptosia nina]|uniref:Large ribosomal subunit protein eL14 n=1 Tax=Leptosia nina TaxID=320188 RepID=A0AAV1K3I7_9NEOP